MKVKLGKLVNVKTGKLDANASSINGAYPFFTCSKEPLKISTYSYDCECVLVAGNGDLNVKYYNGKFDAYQRTYIIEDNGCKKIYIPYLYYFMDKYVEKLRTQSIGGVIKYIKLSNITEVEIVLPNVDIQKKIVDKLDKVNAVINKKNMQLEKLDLLVRSLFIEMFGDIHNNKNYDYTNIEEITSVLSGGTPDRKENKYWEGGTINWVKTTELNNNIIIETEEKITNLGLENSSAKIIPPQSILIAMYGQGKTRGMTGYLEVSSATNQACACILPSRYINQKYLWNYLILSYDKLRSMVKGGNQPNLNVIIIKKFPVLIPPYEPSRKICTKCLINR